MSVGMSINGRTKRARGRFRAQDSDVQSEFAFEIVVGVCHVQRLAVG